MSLLSALFRGKQPEVPFDPNPGIADFMPVRPYRVLRADLPFYSDPHCKSEIQGARLIILRCEDPRQKHETTECMPTLKKYRDGQLVLWEINPKQQWEQAWYVNPGTGQREKAWSLAVEFNGRVVGEKISAAASVSGPG